MRKNYFERWRRTWQLGTKLHFINIIFIFILLVTNQKIIAKLEPSFLCWNGSEVLNLNMKPIIFVSCVLSICSQMGGVDVPIPWCTKPTLSCEAQPYPLNRTKITIPGPTPPSRFPDTTDPTVQTGHQSSTKQDIPHCTGPHNSSWVMTSLALAKREKPPSYEKAFVFIGWIHLEFWNIRHADENSEKNILTISTFLKQKQWFSGRYTGQARLFRSDSSARFFPPK